MNMNEGKYVSVATKVSTWVWARLNAIADKKGMTLYEMAQMVYDTLVRYYIYKVVCSWTDFDGAASFGICHIFKSFIS